MPPNRKANTDVVDSLASLDALQVQPKFLPLTSPASQQDQGQKQQQQQQQKDERTTIYAPHTKDASHPSNSYWDWPAKEEKEDTKEEIIARILKEEEIRQLLTSTHMEETLVASNVEHGETKEAHDNYWDWDNNEAAAKPRAPHANYWDWPTVTKDEEKQQLIQKILEEERIRKELSVDYIQERLVAASPAVEAKSVEVVTTSSSAPEQGYWDW